MRGRKPRVIAMREVEPNEPFIDMNRPGSPNYAARHRQTSYGIGRGMVRVDYGAPAGAQAALAVPAEAPEPEEPKPSADTGTVPSEPPPSSPGPEPDWRKDYGLRKSP